MIRSKQLILFATIATVLAIAAILIALTRGYRFDSTNLSLQPTGILVATSNPNGAQLFVDGELKTATNTTISLIPGTYDIEIKKEGYQIWTKRLTIEKEEVTQADAILFPLAPSFTALTFSGVINPTISPDGTKLAYAIPPNGDNEEKVGLWIMELVDLPLGFSRDPRQITDGDLSQASWEWSPDGREILLSTQKGVFLLDTSTLTLQSRLTNIRSQLGKTLDRWQTLEQKRLAAQLQKVPLELRDILQRKTGSIAFSPDELKILYTASASAEIPQNLIPQLPGSSTQTQERNIKEDQTYIYDIKEDRNFQIQTPSNCSLTNGVEYVSLTTALNTNPPSPTPQQTPALLQATPAPVNYEPPQVPECAIRWLPGSRHLVISRADKIEAIEYDGTNLKTLYSGNYINPHAYPYPNGSLLIFLTTIGTDSKTPNLYTLSLR